MADLVGETLGRSVRWVLSPWAELIPRLLAGEADGIWCGQAITSDRRAIVSFTRPYAVFDEAVLVRADCEIRAPADLRGLRVAAIGGSTNMDLAEQFGGAELVAFDGSSHDVLREMIEALKARKVDAVVEDDVVLLPAAEEPTLEIAFVAPTRNQWAVGVSKERPELCEEINRGLDQVIADGRLAAVWNQWMPTLKYPFAP